MPGFRDSALLGQSHDVALRVGDQREGHAGHVLGLLDDPAAEFSGPAHSAVDVIHRDEEGDEVGTALQRADRGVQRAGNTSVDEGVARDRALVRVGPPEQVTEELPGCVRVFRTDLSMHDWMRHLYSPWRWRAPLRHPSILMTNESTPNPTSGPPDWTYAGFGVVSGRDDGAQ